MRKLLLFLACVALVAVGMAAANATSQHTLASPQSAQPAPATVVRQFVRINQLDCAQYASQAECDTWAYSACSTAALVEVMDFYSRRYRIHDVLTVQAQLGEITPALGLVEDIGIARTAAQFGFKTSWGYHLSYDQVVAAATHTPVIVGWPPARYDGGHLVVVTGGTSQTVFLADSSRFDRHSLSRAQFMAWWAGFSAIVTPEQGGQS